ncbi:prepilin-type N-terminal cleavage/methylation domain-containing protein [Gilvibacter sp.]|uniref:type II secretion system protein n=1 Tax=Gilvibacter sp. TaxID=2729997 RepID=UPI0025B945D3|nr:prepilin-type N-terminal cleavage/methylation domain-containing protein [Gilvibacter sp.]NQX78921.1 prepilin-type N-terminal cleavage/methylation domain-containing protein [Gilvibacter sp.]
MKNKKGFTLVEIMIVVVIIGLLAAMAVPAFQKVRTNSQNKSIVNNGRQIQAAANQYFLEFGITKAGLDDLVGFDSYINAADSDALKILGEPYPATLTQGKTFNISGLPNGAGGGGTDDHTPTSGATALTFSL